MSELIKLLEILHEKKEAIIEEIDEIEENEVDFTENYRHLIVKHDMLTDIMNIIFDMLGDELNAMACEVEE